MKTEQDLYNLLDDLGVVHETISHKPCFSVSDASEADKEIDAIPTRNMFLKDKKKNYWLITLEAHQPVCLKKLCKKLEAKQRLSFGSEEMLWEMLGVKPGAVTPLALINQMEEATLKFVLDQTLSDGEQLAFHPLRNDKTTVISNAGLSQFLERTGIEMQVLDFSDLTPEA